MNVAVWICLAVLLLIAAWGLVGRGSTPGAPETPPRELTADERARVLALRDAGDKIQAIKLHRELTGAGLAASKHAVETM